MGAAALYGAPVPPEHAAHLPFVAPSRSAPAPVLPAPPPGITLSLSPAVAALLFDPFVGPPKAPAPPPPIDTSQQKKARVEGTVLSIKGDPVKRADVRLEVLGPPAARLAMGYVEKTDDAGKFSIEDVPPGSYTLSATKTGYLTGMYGTRSASSSGSTVTLAEGASLKNLDIKMTPQATVSGRVTDRDGVPLMQARVSLYRYTYGRGRKQLQAQPRGRGSTNDQGRFSLSNSAWSPATRRTIYPRALPT